MKKMKFFGSVVAVVVGGLSIQGCGQAPVGQSLPDDPDIIAAYDGGVVTRNDLDRVILARAPNERVPDSGDVQGWYRSIIEEIVLERLLMQDEAIDSKTIEGQLAAFRLEELHRLSAEAYIEGHLPEAEAVTEADARSFFDEHQEQWVQSARREVHNIFLRADEQNPVEALAKTADEIRRRLERGESFAALAEQYSDSESRHQGGFVGWLESRQLTPALAEIVFSLEERQLSESVETPQGVHLFLVTGIVEHRDITFAEAMPRIKDRLTAERREGLIVEMTDGLPEVPETFVARGEDLEGLMRHGEAEAVVLRVGAYRLHVGRLKEMVAKLVADGQTLSGALPERLLELIERRERIFAEAQAQGLDRDPEIEQRLEAAMISARLNLRRQQLIQRVLDEDQERLESWYVENQRRFSSPLRLNATRLVVPLVGVTADKTMAALEALAQSDDPGDALERAADQLGGQIEHDGWKTLPELAAIRPVVARLASNLEINRVSAPYRTATTLEVLLISDRQEPAVQPLAAVYERVRSEYLRLHAAEVYGHWAEATLREAELRFFPERLVASAGQVEGADSLP